MKTVLVSLLLATSVVAQADIGSGSAPKRWENPGKNFVSPQWFAFELKFGPYTPALDSSDGLNGATPFRDLFTNQYAKQPQTVSPSLLTTLELDFQFWHKFGSFAVAASVGFYRKTTHSFQYSDASGTAPCVYGSCTRSGDTTALNVVPVALMLVYRFDVLALRYKVPLVPYAKLGLAYAAWFIQNGAGGIVSIPKPGGGTYDGYGGTFGFVVQPGLALLLDVIDPGTARAMDAEIGINHTYLFCELNYANMNGFGQSNRLNLSDTTLNAGLAFEF